MKLPSPERAAEIRTGHLLAKQVESLAPSFKNQARIKTYRLTAKSCGPYALESFWRQRERDIAKHVGNSQAEYWHQQRGRNRPRNP